MRFFIAFWRPLEGQILVPNSLPSGPSSGGQRPPLSSSGEASPPLRSPGGLGAITPPGSILEEIIINNNRSYSKTWTTSRRCFNTSCRFEGNKVMANKASAFRYGPTRNKGSERITDTIRIIKPKPFWCKEDIPQRIIPWGHPIMLIKHLLLHLAKLEFFYVNARK